MVHATLKIRFLAFNYEKSNFNIGIPDFSIHGNHEMPTICFDFSSKTHCADHHIVLAQEDAFSALDTLPVSGLVNYMGKIDLPIDDFDARNSGIAVRSVLLLKERGRSRRLGHFWSNPRHDGVWRMQCIAWSFHLASQTKHLFWWISSIAITAGPLAWLSIRFIVGHLHYDAQ